MVLPVAVTALLLGLASGYILPTGSAPQDSSVCGDCAATTCPNWQTLSCQHGYTLDECECCFTCAKGLGDTCGGKKNHLFKPSFYIF